VGADPGQLRIGLLTRAPLDMAVAPAPLEAVAVAGRLLESLGHHVAPIEFELFPAEQLIDFLNIVNAGMADYPEVDFERVEPHNQVAYATGRGVDSIAFLHSLGRLQRFSASWSPTGVGSSTCSSPRPWPSSRPGRDGARRGPCHA